MTRTQAALPADAEALVDTCRQKSVELLHANLSPQGIVAATLWRLYFKMAELPSPPGRNR